MHLFGADDDSRTPYIGLLLLTIVTVLVHGYHLGVDDSAIYIPAIKKAADPALYPFGNAFFMSHAHLSFFANLVGAPARWTTISPDLAIFLSWAAGAWLLLIAAWRTACCCFENRAARWCGVVVLAMMFSVPVAGTALVIMDPYLTARTFSTPFTLFAVAAFLSGKNRQAIAWLIATALIHPQMSVYGALFLALLAWFRSRDSVPAAIPQTASLAILPFVFRFEPATGAAREALLSRSYFFVSKWEWYEWIGAIAPIVLLMWISRSKLRNTRPAIRLLARTLAPFGLAFTAAAILLITSPNFENYARLQPLRALHLLYVILFVLVGGLLSEYVLRGRLWRWLCVLVPLAAGMFFLERSTYPASVHIEIPGADSGNPWSEAFMWIRVNTPKNAVFALDPDYMAAPGQDMHGFRAIAERSVLADRVKDSGAVSLFPDLAEEWKKETVAAAGWKNFGAADFRRLASEFPVTWIVVQHAAPSGMFCPYDRGGLAVCQLPHS